MKRRKRRNGSSITFYDQIHLTTQSLVGIIIISSHQTSMKIIKKFIIEKEIAFVNLFVCIVFYQF